MSVEYKTANRRSDPVPFTIDGEQFMFAPHKRAGVVLAIIDGGDSGAAEWEWFETGLNDYDRPAALQQIKADDSDEEAAQRAEIESEGWMGQQVARIRQKLRDSQDPLDANDVFRLINDLTAEISGRPTG